MVLTLLRVINTKAMLAYSCFIVVLLTFRLLFVELFRTHKNQISEVDALTGNSLQTHFNSASFTGVTVKWKIIGSSNVPPPPPPPRHTILCFKCQSYDTPLSIITGAMNKFILN